MLLPDFLENCHMVMNADGGSEVALMQKGLLFVYPGVPAGLQLVALDMDGCRAATFTYRPIKTAASH